MKYQWLLLGNDTLPDIIKTPLSLFGEFVKSESWMTNCNEFSTNRTSLILINCTSITTQEITNSAETLKLMLESNHPILLAKPTPIIKNLLIELELLNCCIEEESYALYIEPCRDQNGNLRLALAEQFNVADGGELERVLCTLNPDNEIISTKSDIFHSSANNGLNSIDIDPFITRIRDSMHELAKNGCISLQNDGVEPPPSVPSNLWTRTPYNIYQQFCPHNGLNDSYKPPSGDITIEYLMDIGIYYDNRKFGRDKPVQWVFISHSGHIYTKMQKDEKEYKGWSLGHFYINGSNISSPELVSFDSSPNNVSGKTSYTSSTGTTVGIEAGTEGISASIEYQIGKSSTSEITDWAVTQNDPNSWEFYQQLPYNGSKWDFPEGSCDNNGIRALPTISKSTLSADTQTMWLHNPATKDKVQKIVYQLGFKSHFIHWYGGQSKSSWKAMWYGYRNALEIPVLLNFKDAYVK